MASLPKGAFRLDGVPEVTHANLRNKQAAKAHNLVTDLGFAPRPRKTLGFRAVPEILGVVGQNTCGARNWCPILAGPEIIDSHTQTDPRPCGARNWSVR